MNWKEFLATVANKIVMLFEMQSFVTVALTIVFCFQAWTGGITMEKFETIFIMVIGYYFGTRTSTSNTLPGA